MHKKLVIFATLLSFSGEAFAENHKLTEDGWHCYKSQTEFNKAEITWTSVRLNNFSVAEVNNNPILPWNALQVTYSISN